jgi:hypothetical protein
MKKKKTAVQWLAEQLIPNAMRMFDAKTCNAIEKALQMEREQIVNAFGIGCQVESTRLIGYHDMANQHYNETYGGQDE